MGIISCEWRKLAFANYIVSPDILQKYLPPHTEIDFFNGNCFVSLVGFQFKNVEVAGIKIPFYDNFEEVNLRFYVKRYDKRKWRHGTVFISEIADKKALKLLANSFLHEKYQTMPMKHSEKETAENLEFQYQWKFKDDWQHIKMNTEKIAHPVARETETAFLIHKLWGYGKHNDTETNEYSISHPLWQVYDVKNFVIKTDFAFLFGTEFSHLTGKLPHSVILAEGSQVKVNSPEKLKQ